MLFLFLFAFWCIVSWGICLDIALGAFTLFIAEGFAFSAFDTAARVMIAFIALETRANVIIARTLLPSTLLADKCIFFLIHYTITHGVSTSIAREAYAIYKGFITVLAELVCGVIL